MVGGEIPKFRKRSPLTFPQLLVSLDLLNTESNDWIIVVEGELQKMQNSVHSYSTKIRFEVLMVK